MTGNDSSATLKAGVTEPRHVYNMVMRRAAIAAAKQGKRSGKNAMKVDWAVSLENGYVPADQAPAKYGFDIGTQDCNNDYVLLGLTVTSGTQANLVGINNLYTGASPACNAGSPWVAFAYNTITQGGGGITTSPSISEDGTKVAFVETATAGSYFHVLVLPSPIPVPPSQTGTVRAPFTPTSCATPTTVNCMTTVQISGSGSPTSPWIDYSTDTAYVGTGDGKLYKISPVFGGGAPTVAADANWPVTVITAGASKVLTDPTVDDNAGRIFIGDANGYLYAIDLNSPAQTTAATLTIGWAGHGAGTGIISPPIVVFDSANPAVDQVFAFTGCSNVVGIGGAANQVPANFTSGTTIDMTNTVDLGSATGAGDCTGANVHAGDFDNEFWTNGSTNGHLLVCGFVSGTPNAPLIPSNPKMYEFSFTAGQLNNGTLPTATWVINNKTGDECSPLTEFYDGTTDRLFFGVGGNGGGGGNDGYIKSSSITAGFPAASGCINGSPTSTCVTTPHKLEGTSSIIVDNQVSNGGANLYFSTLAHGSVNGQKCHVAGGAANPYCAVKLTQSALQ
ncbi:MAG: PQQ-binding-like beta-propeller repeat protein [Terriglobales bacterium]